MSDKSLGSLILALGLVGAIVYLYWLFAPAKSGDLLFFCPGVDVRWALVLPIVVGVMVILIIAMWIGWTMAVTPPPPTILAARSDEKVDEKKLDDKK